VPEAGTSCDLSNARIASGPLRSGVRKHSAGGNRVHMVPRLDSPLAGAPSRQCPQDKDWRSDLRLTELSRARAWSMPSKWIKPTISTPCSPRSRFSATMTSTTPTEYAFYKTHTDCAKSMPWRRSLLRAYTHDTTFSRHALELTRNPRVPPSAVQRSVQTHPVSVVRRFSRSTNNVPASYACHWVWRPAA
jgi:hypothetical protein